MDTQKIKTDLEAAQKEIDVKLADLATTKKSVASQIKDLRADKLTNTRLINAINGRTKKVATVDPNATTLSAQTTDAD